MKRRIILVRFVYTVYHIKCTYNLSDYIGFSSPEDNDLVVYQEFQDKFEKSTTETI